MDPNPQTIHQLEPVRELLLIAAHTHADALAIFRRNPQPAINALIAVDRTIKPREAYDLISQTLATIQTTRPEVHPL